MNLQICMFVSLRISRETRKLARAPGVGENGFPKEERLDEEMQRVINNRTTF